MNPPAPKPLASLFLAFAAASFPALLAHNVSPSPTFLNQALAFALWGGFALVVAGVGGLQAALKATLPMAAALLLVGVAAAWGSAFDGLPASLSLSALSTVLAALVLLLAGAALATPQQRRNAFSAFCWGWLACGVLSVAIALIQVFLPDLADGVFIAASSYPGRAVGNLRQPNHLSSLLLWGCITTIALLELRRIPRLVAAVCGAAMVFAVVLTASRTGFVSVLLLALWGLLDRKLSKPTRVLLLTAPLMYTVSWWLMAQWAAASQHTFGGAARLAESDISSSRFAIWSNTLELIRANPWTGVGFGEFNFAWTLSPFPNRPVAFFDHTHNLPLQLAVELGLPLAALVLGLLGWALWRGARNAWAASGDVGTAQRCAMLMVLMIGLHSLLEYPLWYAYFLLPAAWAWGFALQSRSAAEGDAAPADADAAAAVAIAPPKRRLNLLAVAAWMVVFGAVLSVVDYWRVVVIFEPGEGAASLEQRIAAGQRSVFFAHHADYAAATSPAPVADAAPAFDRATHFLLDTRLMIAWAKALAARGEVEAARYLAARLREFRKADAETFFAPCAAAAAPAAAATSAGAPAAPAAALPFQCEAPQQPHSWRDFLPRR